MSSSYLPDQKKKISLTVKRNCMLQKVTNINFVINSGFLKELERTEEKKGFCVRFCFAALKKMQRSAVLVRELLGKFSSPEDCLVASRLYFQSGAV